MENPERKQEEEMGHGAVSRLPPPLRTPDKQPAAAEPTPARLSAADPATPQPAGASHSGSASQAPGPSTSERAGLQTIQSFAILLRKTRIPEGGWGGGRADWRGRLETAPTLQLALSEKRGVAPSLLCGARTQQHSNRHGHASRPLPPRQAAASPSPRPHPLPNYLKAHSKTHVFLLGAWVF